MTTFVESPRFPDNISYGSSGGPGFKTYVFEGQSAIETPVQAWSRARGKWDVAYGVRDTADMDELRAFFYGMRGRAIAFRYKDWSDYIATDEVIGTGDGANDTFRLIKTYFPENPYVRRIFKPVTDTLVVKVADVEKTAATHYNCDFTTGIITFTAGNIPTEGQVVTASYEFDVPCRFDTDEFDASYEGFQTESWSGIIVMEKLLEEPEA